MRAKNYITVKDRRRNRYTPNEILQLLKTEKNELYVQRNFLDKDLDSTSWRLQDLEEDYLKLLDREKNCFQ